MRAVLIMLSPVKYMRYHDGSTSIFYLISRFSFCYTKAENIKMITSRLIVALSTCLGGVSAHVVAERAPIITAAAVIPRQADNPQGFVGYYSSSGALSCE